MLQTRSSLQTNTSKQLTKGQLSGKTGLARLMAIENLTVIHDKDAPTAAFDVTNRVLILPVLKDMSGPIYDWYIAHEVSHALHTLPDPEQLKKDLKGIPFKLFNVTEDIRIEKLIKRRYPGTVKDAYEFYRELIVGRDLFGLRGVDIQSLGFADRLNIHYKAGAHYSVVWQNQEELDIVAFCDTLETHADAITAAKMISDYMNEQQDSSSQGSPSKSSGQSEDEESEGGQGSSGDNQEKSEDKSDKGQSKNNDKQEEQQESGDSEGSGGNQNSQSKNDGTGSSEDNQSDKQNGKGKTQSKQQDKPEPQVKTQDNFDKGFKDSLQEKAGQTKIQVAVLRETTDTMWDQNVVKLPKIVKKLEDNFKRNTRKEASIDAMKAYFALIAEVKPVINMMVNQFNMRKAADEFQKTQLAKNGKIDLSRLTEYKFVEDLFLRSEVVPGSQNHGLVMTIDWSSSMRSTIGPVIKQTIILMEFCRKLKIPYTVYGFSDNTTLPLNSNAGDFHTRSGHLFEIFCSSMNKKEHTEHTSKVLAATHGLCGSDISHIESMSSTPLNHTAFMARKMVEKFQERHNRQKVAFVLLSDGSPTDDVLQRKEKLIITNPANFTTETITDKAEPYHNFMAMAKQRFGSDFKSIGIFISDSGQFDNYHFNMFYPQTMTSGYTKKLSTLDGCKASFKSKGYCNMSGSRSFDEYFYVDVKAFKANTSSGNSLQDITAAKKAFVFLKLFIDCIS